MTDTATAGFVAAYDTTLRDGAQQQAVSFTVEDKLAVARLLDELGVAYIEGGWPGAIPKDTEFFTRAASELQLRNARLAAFGATCKAGVAADADPQVAALLESGAPVITLVAKSDPQHVVKALRTTEEENLRMVRDTVTYLVGQGREVILDLEHFFDGLVHDADYPLAVALEAARAGASAVVPCDTNGGTLPGQVGQDVARLFQTLADSGLGECVVGIHTHDDSGCAVASSIAAVEAGARQVQGCVNAFGERTGNANLLTVVANLELKTDYRALAGNDDERAAHLAELSSVSRAIGEIANRPVSPRMPYVGARAFAHKAGLHASAIRVDPNLYQHIDPARVGNTMQMLVSEMAGRASIELKARELGVEAAADAAVVGRVVEAVKQREAAGYTYDAADGSFELLFRMNSGTFPEYFRVESWRASVQSLPAAGEELLPVDGDTLSASEATVRLWAGGQRFASLGEGNGPVDALDHALRAALSPIYPEIEEFELADYKVRILDAQHGTDSAIRVLVDTNCENLTWSTVGVGTDIIEASWEALTDALIVGLLRRGIQPR